MIIPKELDLNNIPNHIGIIMDGNGRWAQKRHLPRYMGHRKGSERVIEIVEACYRLNVKSLSLFAFSTENWKRPKDEISKLMDLLVIYIKSQLNRLVENNVKINIMGDLSVFPPNIKKEIDRALSATEDNDKMILNIGLNYGGRDEIIRAVKLISTDLLNHKINIEDINDELFSSYLYTKNQTELDLLIRPSGELRVSNFMLYQLAYSEFWFSDVLWPDFNESVLYEAIIDFQNRNRRFGGV
ncbi:isoprenyl transferase [Anaerosphaera multitolerans]|uniref:Isoprenyl transferase n=1 Tax=Anaerosphaera multitolerans TaxID=2487351 RepID=A0A437S591_9FIRM|nr:isoprenyl transferase [Anaerosphaera multitolerans]RVU54181.1 isoprenyl transferase [Anaerosphaera multitolerans]